MEFAIRKHPTPATEHFFILTDMDPFSGINVRVLVTDDRMVISHGEGNHFDNIEVLQFEEYPECDIFGLSGTALIKAVTCFASAYLEAQK